MSVRTTDVYGAFKPSMEMQFLPKCGNCGAPHPAARGIPDQNQCIDCGHVVTSGLRQTMSVDFKLPGIIGMIASAFLWIGSALRTLAERV